ncbi:GumC family protein [Desulfovibrio subterraneus]|uniref:AAA domain-containing protein n=1 Tax=Desulfovibrio subterraneus TaxID=2718620 RepID=A0A7J0BLN1_9BACT|nr:AAA family ATPase [Desulfovibrio subterraneus]GFM34468.1 hypothetical protein DSM101010T_28330 [Desulfovibrio subterraneus]
MDSIGRARKPFDLFGSIFKYLRVTVLFGGLLFACLSPLAFILSTPFYHATGKILIERIREPFIASTESAPISNFYYDYAQTEVQRLLHDSILTRTLESLPAHVQSRYAPNGATPAAVAGLRSELVVGLIPNTHIIMVQFTSAKPDGIADVVNTLMKTYLEHAEKTEENKDARRLAYLLEERNGLKQEAESLTAQLTSLASQAKTSTFVETYNIDSLRLIELQKAWVVARQHRLELENQFRESAIKAGKIRDLPTNALSDELVAGDESLWSISYWTYKTMQEMRASVDGINARNPDRRYVEQRMDAMKQYEANLKKEVSERARRIVHDKREYELNTELIIAEAAYLASQKTELALLEELHASQTEAAENARRIIKGQDISSTLTHVRDRLHSMDSRIQEIRAESKSPLRIAIEETAEQPGGPAGSNFKKLMFLCFAASFGSVGMGFLVLELSDNRVRSTKDIIHATGHPPSWPISEWSGPSPFHRVSQDAPDSKAALALRSLAVRLNNERVRQGARVALFAAIQSDSGCTTISVNVARCLAGFCERLLLIEMNSEGTALSSLLKYGGQRKGIGECLLEEKPIATCVHRPAGEPFDFLPMGSAWGNEDNNRFGPLLTELKNSYDFIVIDAAPVLRSDMTEFILLQSDIAAMVVQGDRTTYPALRQALEILVRLQVPVITTVLNWGALRTLNKAESLIMLLPESLVRLLVPSLLSGRYTPEGGHPLRLQLHMPQWLTRWRKRPSTSTETVFSAPTPDIPATDASATPQEQSNHSMPKEMKGDNKEDGNV